MPFLSPIDSQVQPLSSQSQRGPGAADRRAAAAAAGRRRRAAYDAAVRS
jgi:hypothetical protein